VKRLLLCRRATSILLGEKLICDHFLLRRQKYQTVESEASKSSEVLKERLGSLKHKVHDVLEEASKSELAKKAGT
jgi:predicted metallo-beta-lactamase superfamily hydrolase